MDLLIAHWHQILFVMGIIVVAVRLESEVKNLRKDVDQMQKRDTYVETVKLRAEMEKSVFRLFQNFDYILGPVSPFPAFKLGEKNDNPLSMYLADICSVLANLTRSPAISIPGKPTKNGLPIGIQIMGRRFEDNNLLYDATAIQEETDYHLKRPF